MTWTIKEARDLPYQEGLHLMAKAGKQAENGNFTLILAEHPPVYTFGKSAVKENLLADSQKLQEIQASVFETERGGDITYHGPGQLTAYPIVNLHQLEIGARTYVETIEDSLIELLQEYGIKAFQIEGLTGIWEGEPGNEAKVAAIGIRISKGITSHGLALNINTNLSYFDHIVPCGIDDKAVTSMESLLKRELNWSEVSTRFAEILIRKLQSSYWI